MTGVIDQVLEAVQTLIDDGIEELPLGDSWGLVAAERRARTCEDCELHRTRRRVVYGEGNPLSSLLIIGEGPGADEDRLGRPFVGVAGRLLDEILSQLGLSREHVYITNIIKCRPPGNRDPLPDEVSACRAFLDEQLACIRPRVIVSLGKHATAALLGRDVHITRLRGQVLPIGSARLVPTLHPAYVLRNGAARVDLEADLSLALSLVREKKASGLS